MPFRYFIAIVLLIAAGAAQTAPKKDHSLGYDDTPFLPGGKWRVSTEGGTLPVWSAATHELLFVDPARNKIMVAPYSVAADSFHVDKPHLWSATSVTLHGVNYTYDLHPDGKRLAIPRPPDSGSDKVVFVFNFANYLRKISGSAK